MQLHLVGKAKKEIMQSTYAEMFSHGVHSKGNYFCQQVSGRFKLLTESQPVVPLLSIDVIENVYFQKGAN